MTFVCMTRQIRSKQNKIINRRVYVYMCFVFMCLDCNLSQMLADKSVNMSQSCPRSALIGVTQSPNPDADVPNSRKLPILPYYPYFTLLPANLWRP